MKFQKGDYVRVKKDANMIPSGIIFRSDMKIYMDKCFYVASSLQIKNKNSVSYRLSNNKSLEPEIDWYFDEKWLEDVNEIVINEKELLSMFNRLEND